MAQLLTPAPIRDRIVSHPTPNVSDRVIKELRNASQANYNVPPYGTPHPAPSLYPDHVLAYVAPEGDSGFASWFYVNQRANQDAYNFVADYPHGLTNHPRYTRTYVLPRQGLAEPALGSADPAFPGFVLVDHRNVALGDQVIESLFVGVQRFYEQLPGPWIPFTRYDDDLGPVQGRRRAVVNTGQQATLTATGKTSYEARDGSAYVSWEAEETWSNGSGGAGNPAYPVGTRDYYDEELGPVQEVSQLLAATGAEAGSASASHNTSFTPFNQFLLKRVHKMWAVPGPVSTRDYYDEELGPVQEVSQLLATTGAEVGSASETHNTSFTPVNEFLLKRVRKTWSVPCPVSTRDFYDEELGAVQEVSQLVAATGSEVGTASSTHNTSFTPFNEFLLKRVDKTWSAPGPVSTRDYYDEELGPVQEVSQLLATTASEVGSASATHNTSFTPVNEFLLKRVHKTWSMPGPVATRDFYDEERGAVQETRQVIAATGSEVGGVTGGSVHTTTVFEPVNTYLVRRIVRTFALPGPTLSGREVLQDGAVATVIKTLKSPDSITEGETLSGGVLRRVDRQVLDAVLAREVITERSVPGVELTSKMAMEGAFGAVGTEVRRLQPKTVALPAESHLVLGARLNQVSQESAELVVRSVTSQPIVYDFDTEEETRELIMTSHQVVATVTPANAASPSVGTEVRYKALTKDRTMKSLTVLNPNTSGGFGGVPSTRTEYVEIDYTYPALLYSISFVNLSAIDDSGEFRLGTYPNIRAAFRRKVKGTVTISYHSTQPAPDGATTIEPVDLYAQGIFVKFKIPNVICNAYSSGSFTTGNNNPKWPYYVETISLPASTPTLSGYNALTEIVVSSSVRLWKFGLWRKETVRIPAL